jgi:hypothetical protein
LHSFRIDPQRPRFVAIGPDLTGSRSIPVRDHRDYARLVVSEGNHRTG